MNEPRQSPPRRQDVTLLPLAALPKPVRAEPAIARCEEGIISHLSPGGLLVFVFAFEVLGLNFPVPHFRGDKLLLFYFPVSIFLFINVAVTAAEKPLSILTTVTPEAQLLSIVKRAESPSKLEP